MANNRLRIPKLIALMIVTRQFFFPNINFVVIGQDKDDIYFLSNTSNRFQAWANCERVACTDRNISIINRDHVAGYTST